MLTECCTALGRHHIAISHVFSSRIQQCRAFVFDHSRPPLLVVFLDERPTASDPSPSLINWMAPRHSARPVSYCPDWARLPRTKPNSRKRKKERINPKTQTPRPLSCGGPSSLVRPLLGFDWCPVLQQEQLMLQHASIALVETECNTDQGWPASCNSQRACAHCPPVAALVVLGPARRLWPSATKYVPLLSVCRDCCIRRAQFPRSPLITNVGGCGGQSSGHAPPRRLVPNWSSSACVNLKPIESNLSLSFETAAPATPLRDREPPHLVAHCVVTHSHTHTHIYSRQYTCALGHIKLRAPVPDPPVQRPTWLLTRMVTPRRDFNEINDLHSALHYRKSEPPTAAGSKDYRFSLRDMVTAVTCARIVSGTRATQADGCRSLARCRHAFLTGARPLSTGSAPKTPSPTDYCDHPYLPQACSSRLPERAAIKGPILTNRSL